MQSSRAAHPSGSGKPSRTASQPNSAMPAVLPDHERAEHEPGHRPDVGERHARLREREPEQAEVDEALELVLELVQRRVRVVRVDDRPASRAGRAGAAR